MTTLQQFAKKPDAIPTATSWYLSDLGEARGRQELHTKQAPQRLIVLRGHALIESAVSSNRIEGVNIEPSRARAIIIGKPLLQDRDEEEIRNYRDALTLIHEHALNMPVSEKTILELHRVSRGDIWDAGKYKERDGDIIERGLDGRVRVRFKPVAAKKAPQYTAGLTEDWTHCMEEKWIHPLIAMAGFNLDFLCIHPFRDGNGRVSRLLLLLQCYQLGYEVGRFISLERLIEENKDRYYETLEQSSYRWHEGKHDPWPYINFLLYILKLAYKEFEQRIGDLKIPRGAKTDLVEMAVKKFRGDFSVAQLEKACPGVSRDMVRIVLRNLQKEGVVECTGRGPGAKWRKTGQKNQ